MAESHARLSLHPYVMFSDAVAAIRVFEENLAAQYGYSHLLEPDAQCATATPGRHLIEIFCISKGLFHVQLYWQKAMYVWPFRHATCGPRASHACRTLGCGTSKNKISKFRSLLTLSHRHSL